MGSQWGVVLVQGAVPGWDPCRGSCARLGEAHIEARALCQLGGAVPVFWGVPA